jgi:hypothetical protein
VSTLTRWLSQKRVARQCVEVNTVVLSTYALRDLCQALCDALMAKEEGLTALVGVLRHAPKAVGAESLTYDRGLPLEHDIALG